MKQISNDYIPYVMKSLVVLVLESKSEVSSLPLDVAPSSVAMLVEPGLPMWMMSANGQWKAINKAAEDQEV